MAQLRQGDRSRQTIGARELKLCGLCGTLNHVRNEECFTCGWRGAFSGDAAAVQIAWQRLDVEFEGVRLEHVTARRTLTVGDFGVRRPAGPWQRLRAAWRQWWLHWANARSRRIAERQAALRGQIATPPNELGV